MPGCGVFLDCNLFEFMFGGHAFDGYKLYLSLLFDLPDAKLLI
jgi:hypothetical protein